MSKETYNYKEVFDQPLKVKQLTKDFALPFFVPVAKIVIFVVTFLILLAFFKDIISALNNVISGLHLVIYVGVPYLVANNLMKIHPNGKKLHYFLYDLGAYYFTILLPKKKFCHDEEAKYIDNKFVLEPFYGRKVMKEDAAKNATENDS